MKRHDIQHFASENELTAAVVERFNNTIKIRIWTYFSDRGTVSWVNVIQNLVDAYNYSRNPSIGMAPADVKKINENRIWVSLFGDGDFHLKPLILQKVMVPASSNKTIFEKGYMPNWTKRHFTVSKAVPPKRGTKRRVYKLVDYNNEAVKDSSYPRGVTGNFRQPVPNRENSEEAHFTWRFNRTIC